MRRVGLILLAPLVAAAAPRGQRPFELQVRPSTPLLEPLLPPALATQPGPAYQPAPMPDRSLALPDRPAQASTEFTPTLFHRDNSFRGEGFSPGSSAQSDENKHVTPGAGFSLHMPIQTEPQR